MKIKKKTKINIFLSILLSAALIVVLLPLQVWAEVPNDGIPSDITVIYLPPECVPGTANCADFLIDPDKADVFVRTAQKGDRPPLIAGLDPDDFDLFEFFSTNTSVKLHRITKDQAPDQKVYGPQYAVLLYDDTSNDGEALGLTDLGTPVDKLSGDVYTTRIWEEVEKALPSDEYTSRVADSDGNPILGLDGNAIEGNQGVFEFYVKNVAAHETFHMLGRVVPKHRRYDFHTPQEGYIMDHHMVYKVSKNKKTVTWFITDQWLLTLDEDGNDTGDIPRF